MKHCYTAIGLFYLSNQEKITAKLAVQVCGSKKSFAFTEVQKITAKLRICGCGPPIAICSCEIDCKFSVPSTGLILFVIQAFDAIAIVYDEMVLKFFNTIAKPHLKRLCNGQVEACLKDSKVLSRSPGLASVEDQICEDNYNIISIDLFCRLRNCRL